MSDSSTSVWPDALPTPLLGRQRGIGSQALATRMDSGRVRVRQTQTVPLELQSVRWNFTAGQFSEFLTFFQEDLENGELSFLMPTAKTGETDQDEKEFAFWEGRFDWEHTDNLFAVSATLELIPEPVINDVTCDLGSGAGVAGDSFICYYDGSIGPFGGGNGWDGEWAFDPVEGIAVDSFDDYIDGFTGDMARGLGWDGEWVFDND